MTPELSNALAALAQKLGTSVEHLWPALVARARFEAAVGIAFYILLTAALTAFIIAATKAMKREDDWCDVNPVWPIGSIVGVVVIVGCIACALNDAVNYAYPEVAALKTILGK